MRRRARNDALEIVEDSLEGFPEFGRLGGQAFAHVAGPYVGHHAIPFGVLEISYDPAHNAIEVGVKVVGFAHR